MITVTKHFLCTFVISNFIYFIIPNELISLYIFNHLWNKFLDEPYILKYISDMRKITYIEDNKLAHVIKQLDLIDPSRLYQLIGKYECLLKSIKNKNNY